MIDTPHHLKNFYPMSENPAAFRRSREQWGEFSNMCSGYPLDVNGIRFQSSEGLYQALKFPHDVLHQELISVASNGYVAKVVSYAADSPIRPDWDDAKLDAMRLTLAIKFSQHPALVDVLMSTGDRPIVESSNKDAFWGAIPGVSGFRGDNHLGELLMDLRNAIRLRRAMLVNTDLTAAFWMYSHSANRWEFTINGKGVRPYG